ncbi:MAG: hypothetical protein ABI867_24815 [Kofleriaceae bacterium]
MELRRFVGLVDLGILTVVLAAVVMPPREMYASAAMKGTDNERLVVALAEARTIAQPKDAGLVDEFAHQLGEAGFKDWAVEAGIDGSARTKDQPEHWRALLAASVAYIDRLEAKPALKFALAAFDACKQAGDAACPTWERTRLEIYKEHLSAGVEAGIDPKRDPKKFREAGEGRIRTIRIGGPNP